MNPEELPSIVNQHIYPVLVDSTVKSSLTVVETKGQRKTVAFGNPNFIRLLTMNRGKGSGIAGVMLSGSFSVQVLALNMFFLSKRIGDTWLLTAVLDDPQ